MAMTGQCLCGEIKYEIGSTPAMTGVCHCKNCQRKGAPLSRLLPEYRSQISASLPESPGFIRMAIRTAATLLNVTSVAIADHRSIQLFQDNLTHYSLKPAPWMTPVPLHRSSTSGATPSRIGYRSKKASRKWASSLDPHQRCSWTINANFFAVALRSPWESPG